MLLTSAKRAAAAVPKSRVLVATTLTTHEVTVPTPGLRAVRLRLSEQ